MPGIEQDMYRLHELGDKVNTKVVMNNNLLIELSQDKLLTYKFFAKEGLNVIPTLFKNSYNDCVSRLGSPFLLKPRHSYASKGIHKIYTEEEFAFYNKDPEANIFQRTVSAGFRLPNFGRIFPLIISMHLCYDRFQLFTQ